MNSWGKVGSYTCRLDCTVSAFNMALQLERSQVLSVAMLAGCVAFKAFTILLLQLQVVLHMVHEPTRGDEHTQLPFNP